MLTDKEEGMEACRAYYHGQALGAFTKNVKAKDAIKLFKPPVKEMLTQISMPLPQDRKDWIEGFKEEQAKILSELVVS